MSGEGEVAANGLDGHRRKLADMAGDIAAFFRAYPEEVAVASIAEHINQFWSRRMRQDLVALARAGAVLDPLVREALPKLSISAATGEGSKSGASERI